MCMYSKIVVRQSKYVVRVLGESQIRLIQRSD